MFYAVWTSSLSLSEPPALRTEINNSFSVDEHLCTYVKRYRMTERDNIMFAERPQLVDGEICNWCRFLGEYIACGDG